jgi:DNA-directed RNA polymerase subunit RPC12/RpoP
MAEAAEITCPMCGFKNPADRERCQSCGARVEALSSSQSDDETYARRYQQEDFEWKWALIATALFSALQGLILGVIPLAVSAFDPQGLPGLMLSVPVAFVGGIVMGAISPGKTFVEPAVGAMLASVPTIAIISAITPSGAFEPTLLAYVICATMGIMMALFGAFLGEKIQMGGGRKTA